MSDNPYILVVEDDADIKQFLQSSLQLNGYKVTCFSHLEEAKRHFACLKPLLTILDLNLPDGDGAEFITSIRASICKISG